MDKLEHANSDIAVGLVGAGYWGQNHLRIFSELGALAHVCEVEDDTRDKVGCLYPGVTVTDCYADLLENPEIRGIVVATPAPTHYELTMRALDAGKDVLVEKPLSLKATDGEELVRLAAAKGAILMVGHILLYHPAVIRLKELIDTGELGKVTHVQSNRLSLGKIRTEENILWSFAPHDISVILHLLGELPNQIQSTGYTYLQRDVEDVTVTNLKFPSGVGAHIYVSWMNPFKEHRLVVIGEHKMAVFEDSLPGKKLQLFNHAFRWVKRRPLPCKGEVEEVEVNYQEPLREEGLHFLECIRTRNRPRSDGEEGLRTLRVLEQCSLTMGSQSTKIHQVSPSVNKAQTDFFVHETAVVEEPCSIGEGTKIWHFSHVMPHAQIGKNCNIGQNVVVGKGVRMGNQCKIQNNVSVYEGVTLEDYVFCGPSMVFTNVHNPRCEIPRMLEIRPTLVRKGATMGANSTIICGNTIGEYAFIGAGAVVTGDVSNHALVVGNPARRVGWMCQCANRLEGKDAPGSTLKCLTCGKQYVRDRDGLAPLEAPTPVESVPLLDLKSQYRSIRGEVRAAIDRVLESQHFILGPEVQALEEEIAQYCGCKYAVGVSSGTDALLVSLMALGVSSGDEVITTPFTFFATVGSILRLGASVIFADIQPDSFNIDPVGVEKAITPRTKAILPVHLFGQCADMGPLLGIANPHGIPIIEDAAQAIGSEYLGRRAGSMGALGCFSFFPSKNLGAFGDGGIITTNDEVLAERIRAIRNQGAKPKYYHSLLGGNFRLDALQAAILRVKLKHLQEWSDKRRENAAFYTQRLGELGLAGDKILPPQVVYERHIYNQYVIRADDRDGLKKFLGEKKVATEIYYPIPMHLQECLAQANFREGDFPISERASESVLALPIYPELTTQQQAYVVDKIAEFYGK